MMDRRCRREERRAGAAGRVGSEMHGLAGPPALSLRVRALLRALLVLGACLPAASSREACSQELGIKHVSFSTCPGTFLISVRRGKCEEVSVKRRWSRSGQLVPVTATLSF